MFGGEDSTELLRSDAEVCAGVVGDAVWRRRCAWDGRGTECSDGDGDTLGVHVIMSMNTNRETLPQLWVGRPADICRETGGDRRECEAAESGEWGRAEGQEVVGREGRRAAGGCRVGCVRAQPAHVRSAALLPLQLQGVPAGGGRSEARCVGRPPQRIRTMAISEPLGVPTRTQRRVCSAEQEALAHLCLREVGCAAGRRGVHTEQEEGSPSLRVMHYSSLRLLRSTACPHRARRVRRRVGAASQSGDFCGRRWGEETSPRGRVGNCCVNTIFADIKYFSGECEEIEEERSITNRGALAVCVIRPVMFKNIRSMPIHTSSPLRVDEQSRGVSRSDVRISACVWCSIHTALCEHSLLHHPLSCGVAPCRFDVHSPSFVGGSASVRRRLGGDDAGRVWRRPVCVVSPWRRACAREGAREEGVAAAVRARWRRRGRRPGGAPQQRRHVQPAEATQRGGRRSSCGRGGGRRSPSAWRSSAGWLGGGGGGCPPCASVDLLVHLCEQQTCAPPTLSACVRWHWTLMHGGEAEAASEWCLLRGRLLCGGGWLSSRLRRLRGGRTASECRGSLIDAHSPPMRCSATMRVDLLC